MKQTTIITLLLTVVLLFPIASFADEPTSVVLGRSEQTAVINRILLWGMSGDDVKALQSFLANDKVIYPEARITGFYGKLTVAAVQKFQKKYGIEVLGGVGPQTMSKLNELMSAQKTGLWFSDVTSKPTPNGVAITWKTSAPAASKIWFGAPSPLNLSMNPLTTVNFSAGHSASFSGLATSTEYYYVLYGADEKGNTATSSEYSFATLAQ